MHKERIDRIPNSVNNRHDIELEIYGSDGIPEQDLKQHERDYGIEEGGDTPEVQPPLPPPPVGVAQMMHPQLHMQAAMNHPFAMHAMPMPGHMYPSQMSVMPMLRPMIRTQVMRPQYIGTMVPVCNQMGVPRMGMLPLQHAVCMPPMQIAGPAFGMCLPMGVQPMGVQPMGVQPNPQPPQGYIDNGQPSDYIDNRRLQEIIDTGQLISNVPLGEDVSPIAGDQPSRERSPTCGGDYVRDLDVNRPPRSPLGYDDPRTRESEPISRPHATFPAYANAYLEKRTTVVLRGVAKVPIPNDPKQKIMHPVEDLSLEEMLMTKSRYKPAENLEENL